jgi:hypothetical protein
LRRTVLSHVTCPALPYFSTLSHKRRDFRGGGASLNVINVFRLSCLLRLKRFSPYEEFGDRISQMHIGLHVECPIFLSDFNATGIFSTYSGKKYSNVKFHGNPSSGSRVVLCGRTDRHEVKAYFPRVALLFAVSAPPTISQQMRWTWRRKF